MTRTTYTAHKDKMRFYRSKDWLYIREQALKRDNYECQQCKRDGLVKIDSKKEEGKRKKVILNVHHKKEIETHPELALELDNLETVCVSCHNKIHGRGYVRQEKKWNDERW